MLASEIRPLRANSNFSPVDKLLAGWFGTNWERPESTKLETSAEADLIPDNSKSLGLRDWKKLARPAFAPMDTLLICEN